MSQEERKLRRKKKKKWRLILIGFVFIYLFFRSTPSLFAIRFKTILPEKKIIEDKIQTEAIVVKKENLYRADGEGKIEIVSNEGERVARGTKVAKLTLLNDTSTLNQELGELDRKIDMLAKAEKDKLFIYDNEQKDISGENTLIDQSLESLRKKRQELANQIYSNIMNYFSKEAGILSFKIDGYEEIYSFNHKEDYNYSDFKQVADKQKIVKDNNHVKAGEPIFKIIDNFEWYMIIKLENIKDISPYKEGDPILLTGDQIEGELKGYIEKVNREKNKGLILCKFNSDFHNYYDKRHMKVNIIKYKHEGFKIPTKSIVEKDGIKGVYIKDISGIIKYKPIEILKEEDKVTYIKYGDKNNNIEVKGSDTPIKTVTIFDEILLNTINIKEGMIIN
ncbi:MAG: hypothetical protein GX987_06070 [Tissierellia bacterium]|nr:hypothetical protein [Tissierellia bacterium]